MTSYDQWKTTEPWTDWPEYQPPPCIDEKMFDETGRCMACKTRIGRECMWDTKGGECG